MHFAENRHAITVSFAILLRSDPNERRELLPRYSFIKMATNRHIQTQCIVGNLRELEVILHIHSMKYVKYSMDLFYQSVIHIHFLSIRHHKCDLVLIAAGKIYLLVQSL